ncbi:MAG: hypothetical protein VX089_01575, partial [Pseudomonadota bacterium]|nr:hypothetical protein [Pseudomonadota bacterium]
WTTSAFTDDSKLRNEFFKIKNTNINKINNLQRPANRYVALDNYAVHYSIKKVLKRMLIKLFFKLEFIIKDILAFKIQKRMSFYRILMFEYYGWSAYNFFEKFSISDIKGFNKPFIFFALALEPEFSVHARSKEFNNQEAIIRQLAINMPAGYDLVVKEHVDIGRRENQFYKRLLRFPNIKIAHPKIPGSEIVKKSIAVASLVGTVTLEACIEGKYAIEFSRHSSFSFMSNVITVTDIAKLREVLLLASKKRTCNEIEKIKKNAATLIASIERSSFKAGNTPLFYGNKYKLNPSQLKIIIEQFIFAFRNKKI